MSHAINSLDDTLAQNKIAHRREIRQPVLSLDDVLRLNQVALDMVSEPIVFFSAPTSQLVHANRSACASLGYSLAEMRCLTFLDVAPDGGDGELAANSQFDLEHSEDEAPAPTVLRHRSGSLLPVNLSIRALPTSPITLYVAVGQLIGARGRSGSQYVNAASRDNLTQLPNRSWLWRQLEREVRSVSQYNHRLAVLFMDIDRFKETNDQFGHLAGDQVIHAVARRLKAVVRPSDDICRYGGDEFVIVLKGVQNSEAIRRIAERIGRAVNVAGKDCAGKAWRATVTVSIGIAIGDGKCLSAADLIERADRAMYRAKALGRNGQFVIDGCASNFERNIGASSEIASQ